VSARTGERYTDLCRKNLIPALGAVALAKLQPIQISQAYSKALANGRRDGQGGLSPSTVVYMHRVLKHALSQSVRWQLLSRNPADVVKPPKLKRPEMVVYDVPQTAELLEVLRGTRLRMPVVLAVLCGLRRGEICALRWRHVDFSAGQITVAQSAEQTTAGVSYKEPKAGRGRTVALSATVVTELRAHRLQQAEELLRLGIRQTEETFVYTREDGEPMQPGSVTHAWQLAVVTTGLPRIRFHDLRHAHATHLLASGVHPKVASERLGHSKVGITLDLYSHVLPGMQADAAARVDDALQAAISRRPKNTA
jgi:integrase